MPPSTYHYAIGKRKTSIARVRLFENGSGKITVNEKKIDEYFIPFLVEKALSPLELTGHRLAFDVVAQLEGGGPNGQADALRHGISRALLLFDPECRGTLKKVGFLRRDSRSRERKKPGLKRARRAPQWAKR